MGKGPAGGQAVRLLRHSSQGALLVGRPRTRVLVPPISPGCHAVIPPTSALGLLLCCSCSWAMTPTLS